MWEKDVVLWQAILYSPVKTADRMNSVLFCIATENFIAKKSLNVLTTAAIMVN